MAFFGLRFDMRMPGLGAKAAADRYAAAIEMCEWADSQGFVLVSLSEHHGSADGYLPSPVVLGSAIAARTTHMRILLSALVAPFHEPLRLAEDLAVLDLISCGRIDLVVANGYVRNEFEMFDVPMSERVARTETLVRTLKRAWQGPPFEHLGRMVHVTPAPLQSGGPRVDLGGSSEKAARRAAHLADGFMPSTATVWDAYRDECAAVGRPDPGPFLGGDPAVVFVADDPDAAWATIAPHAMREVNAYGESLRRAGLVGAASYRHFESADELRSSGLYRVLTPAALVDELNDSDPLKFVMVHPLVGGLDPQVGWETLDLLAAEVMPLLV